MAIRRPRYTFLKDESAPHFKAALILGGISLFCMIVLIILASVITEGINMVTGAVGLSAMLIGWYSFLVSMRELVKRPVNVRLAIISSIFTGIVSIIWLALFLAGIKQA